MSTLPPGPDWQPNDPAQQPGYPPPPQGYYPQQATPTPAGDPLVPADFGGWFDLVIGVVRRSWVPLLLIQLVVAVISAVYSLVLRGLDGTEVGTFIGVSLLSVVVLLAIGMFAQGASVFIAIRDAAGEQTTPAVALGFAATRALPLLGWSFLAGLLMVLGFVALIVPGLYLAIVFFATLTGVVTVEQGGLGRCFTLVHRRFWPTAGRILLYGLISVSYFILVNVVVGLLVGADSAAATLLEQVLTIPLSLAGVGVAVVTYAELRFHERPDVRTPTLAAELRH
ncbi:MAG: hypothetical protein ACRDRU_17955 [Pseudonocardiaceae bacterium]